MAKSKKAGGKKHLGDAFVVERLQSILVNAAEGRRSIADDAPYVNLRGELIRRRLGTPPLVATHPSVDSFAAYIKGIKSKPDRVARVRKEFESLLQALEAQEDAGTDPSAWGAPPTRVAKLKALQQTLPLAQAAVEGMIARLSEPGPNNGPLLDGREEALEHLRHLHTKLGELLAVIETGRFDDELGEGLAADVVRFGKRTARALRDDPVPYMASTLLLGLFHALDMPGVAGHLSGMALAMRRHATGAD